MPWLKNETINRKNEMDEMPTVLNAEDIAAAQATLELTRAAAHPCCLLCGSQNVFGLKLDFRVCHPGVAAQSTAFRCAGSLHRRCGKTGHAHGVW